MQPPVRARDLLHKGPIRLKAIDDKHSLLKESSKTIDVYKQKKTLNTIRIRYPC